MIHIWSGAVFFLGFGLGSLVSINENLTAKAYNDISDNSLFHFYGSSLNMTMTPMHRARSLACTDLNPIQNLWDELKERKTRPLVAEEEKLPASMFQNLVESLPRTVRLLQQIMLLEIFNA